METFQDVLLIALFFLTIVVVVLLIVLVLQIMQLIRLIRGEVTPILSSVKRTTGTVKGTAEFMSETTVVPVIRAVSALAAVNRFVRAWLGLTRH